MYIRRHSAAEPYNVNQRFQQLGEGGVMRKKLPRDASAARLHENIHLISARAPRLIVCAGICAAILCGCSGGANQAAKSDSRAASAGQRKLSPEECMAGAEIQQASAPASEEGYVIQPGDQLDVQFYLSPEFNDEVTVRPDGKVALRLVGDEQAAGLTPMQLASALDRAYSSELRSPDASVHVKNMPTREVFVEGQVTRPGGFPLESGMTALQAVSEAGGLTEDAATNVVLIRRDACGQPHGIKVNLAEANGKMKTGEDVALMPRDILIVPRSKIANVDLFVKQYMTGLLPIPPYLTLPAM
jgi:polysaccharide export outer membrane protein